MVILQCKQMISVIEEKRFTPDCPISQTSEDNNEQTKIAHFFLL